MGARPLASSRAGMGGGAAATLRSRPNLARLVMAHTPSIFMATLPWMNGSRASDWNVL